METVLSKWGNSLAIRLPRAMVDSLGWQAGDNLEFIQSEGLISLKKVRNIHRPPLSEVLGSFHTAQEIPNIDWGKPMGKEVW